MSKHVAKLIMTTAISNASSDKESFIDSSDDSIGFVVSDSSDLVSDSIDDSIANKTWYGKNEPETNYYLHRKDASLIEHGCIDTQKTGPAGTGTMAMTEGTNLRMVQLEDDLMFCGTEKCIWNENFWQCGEQLFYEYRVPFAGYYHLVCYSTVLEEKAKTIIGIGRDTPRSATKYAARHVQIEPMNKSDYDLRQSSNDEKGYGEFLSCVDQKEMKKCRFNVEQKIEHKKVLCRDY